MNSGHINTVGSGRHAGVDKHKSNTLLFKRIPFFKALGGGSDIVMVEQQKLEARETLPATPILSKTPIHCLRRYRDC